MAPKLSGSNSSDLMILCVQWCNQCRMAGTGTCTTAGSHIEYCAPPSNYRQPPSVSCLVFVVITVNVLRTPNERRVGGRARLLSGVWPQKILWGWPSSRPKTSSQGVCMKIFWLFPIRTKWKPSGLLTQEHGTIRPLTLKQVESYQRPDSLSHPP